METINYECYVSFEIAKLLKKAGFNWEVKSYRKGLNGIFETTSIPNNFNDGTLTDWLSSPTIDVAQRWLREIKKIHIEITFGNKWIYTLYNLTNLECLLSENEFPKTRNYNTYEEAQEAGIKKAIEIILEKGE